MADDEDVGSARSQFLTVIDDAKFGLLIEAIARI